MFALLACSFALHMTGTPLTREQAEISVTCSAHASYCDASEQYMGDVRVCFDDDFAADGDTYFALRQTRMRETAKDCALYVMAAHKNSGQPEAKGGDVLSGFRTERQRMYVVYAQEQVRLGTLEIRDALGLDSARWALDEMWVTAERLAQTSLHILTDAPSYHLYKGRFGSTTGRVMGSTQACQSHADSRCVSMTVEAGYKADHTLLLSALMAMHMRQAM